MNNQRRSMTRLLAAVVSVVGLVAVGVGGAAAQADRRTWVGVVSTSAPRAAKSPHVSFLVVRRVPVGATVTMAGTVGPSAPRSTVKLQRRGPGAWQTVLTKRLTRKSTYRFSATFATTGDRRFRVVVPRHGATRKITSTARTVGVTTPGYDVSYPQCERTPPAGSFGVVGVDGGLPYAVNPCLAAEIASATTAGRPAYYVNTANPGPTLSTHWPAGQLTPRVCAPTALDSSGCSYDYGVNAAADSYARAVAAAASVGAPAVAGATWWLDAETGNTWESVHFGQTATNYATDTAALTGMRDYLRAQGVPIVGVYSTAHQWQRITGGASLGRAPVWYAGLGGPSSAAAHCASAYGFSGGPVRLTQYAKGGFDADNAC
jgi:hypothetical protein